VCTLSWLREPESYTLFFNRDERRTRARALPPRIERADGVRFLAPRDPDGGGTWLAANEHGIALALLNLYDVAPEVARRARRSRGLLVLSHAGVRSLDRLEERLRVTRLADYAPFELVGFEPGGDPRHFTWDGDALRSERQASEAAPLASSSVAQAAARASRRAQHADLIARAGAVRVESLDAFHRDHGPERGPLSTCMHRADAATVSYSQVRIAHGRVSFAYAAGAPCQVELGTPLVLGRS
jgi:hypothetical protein